MNFKKVGNILLSIGAVALPIIANVVGNIKQERQMKAEIAEGIAKALSEKAKEV